MYKCERCGGVFTVFKTPGQCPLCGVHASVKCADCGFIAHADRFIQNRDMCPKCGAQVVIPGGGSASSSGCVIVLLLIGTLLAVAAVV